MPNDNKYNFNDFAVYIHYPFCISKCPYCDFNSHVVRDFNKKVMAKAYIDELIYNLDLVTKDISVSSIFFGGGTPSLMEPDLVAEIITTIGKRKSVYSDVEITLEANPATIDMQKFLGFRQAGVNRLSLGVQSFNNEVLKYLGRSHCAKEAMAAIAKAKEVFDNVSFDLIYGAKNQTGEIFKLDLETAISFETNHLSFYELIIEEGTVFFKKKEPAVANDRAILYQNLIADRLTKHGFERYEISNYARKKQESKHNKAYWLGKSYIGVGAGAHGRIYSSSSLSNSSDYDGQWIETANFRSPVRWLAAVEDKGNSFEINKKISYEERLLENTIMGLRLSEGLTRNDTTKIIKMTGDKIGILIKENLLVIKDGRLIATKSGFLKLNSVTNFLIESIEY